MRITRSNWHLLSLQLLLPACKSCLEIFLYNNKLLQHLTKCLPSAPQAPQMAIYIQLLRVRLTQRIKHKTNTAKLTNSPVSSGTRMFISEDFAVTS